MINREDRDVEAHSLQEQPGQRELAVTNSHAPACADLEPPGGLAPRGSGSRGISGQGSTGG